MSKHGDCCNKFGLLMSFGNDLITKWRAMREAIEIMAKVSGNDHIKHFESQPKVTRLNNVSIQKLIEEAEPIIPVEPVIPIESVIIAKPVFSVIS